MNEVECDTKKNRHIHPNVVFVLLHLCVPCTFLQASVSPTLCSSVLSWGPVGSSSSLMGPTAMLSHSFIKSTFKKDNIHFNLSEKYIDSLKGLLLQSALEFPSVYVLSCRRTFISTRMSEGSEALWLQVGGQDVTLSLPCFLLGVMGCSWVTGSSTAPSPSLQPRATGLPTAFITRSYRLFHSRLISADRGGKTESLSWMSLGNFKSQQWCLFSFHLQCQWCSVREPVSTDSFKVMFL